MRKIIEIKLSPQTQIYFGIPDTADEKKKMFHLRYKVYVQEKKYIPAGVYSKEYDIDEHDKLGECIYFIAKKNEKIIGTIRMIRKDVLPTESEYFKFSTPKILCSIPRNQRVEIGRIISRPQIKSNSNIPRGVIMLGLFYSAVIFTKEKNIIAGYGTIKESALLKFLKNGIPLRTINDYTVVYQPENSNDPLKKFFSKEDPPRLIYFLRKDLEKYMKIVFMGGIFRQLDKGKFAYIGDKNFFRKIFMKIRITFLFFQKFI